MTTRQTTPRNACEPPTPPAGVSVVVATDYDRTFTRSDLALDAQALARARQLRANGTRLVLCTGRQASDLPLNRLRDCFDAMVIEGGAVWGKPGQWTLAPTPPAFWATAARFAREGLDVRQGWASYSIPADTPNPQEPLAGCATLSPNHDRIDVTPLGYDKGHSLQAVLDTLGLSQPWLLVVADGPNDVPMAHRADSCVAVANASNELRAVAHAEAPHAAHRGFLWAVSRIDKPARHQAAEVVS